MKANMSTKSPVSTVLVAAAFIASLAGCSTVQDVIDPDCTAEKAAQSVVLKSTVGVGNRCTPAEVVRDSTEIDEKLSDAAEKLPD